MQLIRLISPVIIATATSLLALSAAAVFFTNRLDMASIDTEQRTVVRLISGIPKNMVALAEDNSWWDEAVVNIHLSENMDWIEQTFWIDESLPGTEGVRDMDGTTILRPDNSVIFEMHRTRRPANMSDLLLNGLGTALSSLQPTNAYKAVSTHGYAVSLDRIFAIGISMVQPSGFKEYDPPLGTSRRPVLMFYRELNTRQLEQFSEISELQDFRFNNSDKLSKITDLDATVILTGLNGMPIGYFSWTPARPGAALLKQLFWPAIFFLGLICIAGYSFVRRAQKLVDDLAKADRAKMAFLASMSHEVRTPLNAIIGFTEILRHEAEEDDQNNKNKEYLDIIHTSSEHLLTVINDILNISKLDAGKMEVFAAEMNPAHVVSEAVRMLENSARERSIRIIEELEPATIVSDERIIRQILINLLSNAVKFTEPSGQVSIRSEASSETYFITVSDTGIGMNQDEIDVALAPFGQIHHNRQHTSVGTGLGLPLVNRFITLIGGNMTIRSSPGHGTSIKLEVPNAVTQKAHQNVQQELLY